MFNFPCRVLLKYQDASPPKAAHIPMSRLFFEYCAEPLSRTTSYNQITIWNLGIGIWDFKPIIVVANRFNLTG